jgi:adhesin transport system membrane fusion protein
MYTQHTPKKPEQFRDVSNADYIEKSGYTVLVRKIITYILFMIGIFIVWSLFAKINEVAVSYGEVAPTDDVHLIQHVQGGTIAKIFVKNGDEVQEGQPLLKFDPDVISQELKKALSRELTLLINAARLRGFIENKPVDWKGVIKHHPYNIGDGLLMIDKAIKEDQSLLKQQNVERQNQYAMSQQKITQKESDLKQYTDTKTQLEKKLALYQKEEEMYRSVVDKGYVSKRDYIEIQAKVVETLAQLKQVKARIISSTSEIQEAKDELKKFDAIFNRQSLEKLDDINAELLAIQHTIKNLSDQRDKLVIKATTTGLVKGLTVTVGSVVAAGAQILDIVPTRSPMIINCKISTKDVGHVKVGDPAEIKVMAYEFTRYGIVTGKVIEISASTFETEKGLPYYKGKISLDKNYVGDNPKSNRLIPGMTVEVDIITGKRSVMSYLLKPITRGLKTSFREP